jgi:hypothetical protein
MKWDEMKKALDEAEQTIKIAELQINRMSRFIIGRMKKIDSWYLCEMKRELRNYNMHTGEWK